jgi:Putative 2OG-Fe(II) oxygenase
MMNEIDVWPKKTRLEKWIEPTVKIANFPDTEQIRPGLLARALELEHDETLSTAIDGIAGCRKIYHLDRWQCPEADLIDARAKALFKRIVGAPTAAVDLSWANIYRQGDYCLPHGHVRATAAVIYFLELGNENRDGPGHGRFCFADPRLKVCCQREEHAMTTPSGPIVENGTMIIFPGKLVHFVDTYRDPETRVTLSWNINSAPIPGNPLI